MKHWELSKLAKNHYKMTKDDKYIEFVISSDLVGNPEILFEEPMNISEDNVLFIPETLPTLDEDPYAIIGSAFRYDGRKCVEHSLVDAKVIDTNVTGDAKRYVEVLCA